MSAVSRSILWSVVWWVDRCQQCLGVSCGVWYGGWIDVSSVSVYLVECGMVGG